MLADSVTILGVGNRLRGDDAIGCIICDELCKEMKQDGDLPPRHQDTKVGPEESAPGPLGVLGVLGGCSPTRRVHVLDCGNTPENYVQPVADRKPTRILVVDCCSYGAQPGEFRLFSREEVGQLSYGLLSTHTLPLTLTIEMLSLETGAKIELLGIQPQQIEFGTDLSPSVRAALPLLVARARAWVSA